MVRSLDVCLYDHLSQSRVELIHEGVVDLNPPYQRGEYSVVSISHRTFFLFSI